MYRLAKTLALERIGDDRFLGRTPPLDRPRVFGGQVVAQCLLAAYETVTAQICHSLHAYFIHPGDAEAPITFEVDRTRDGTSFTTRRVSALQDGRPILVFTASFQKPDDGFDHQDAAPMVLAPETLTDDDERGIPVGVQIRSVERPRPGIEPNIRPASHQVWFRSQAPLGSDPRMHQAALAYAADFVLMPATVQPHPVTWRMPGLQSASLDHAVWFHRPVDFEDWHLCDIHSPSAFGARGLARASIFSRDGALVASAAQEVMMRVRLPKG